MLSFVPPEIGEPISVVDTFERTSSGQVRALRDNLRRAYEEDRGRSRIRDLLERFESLSTSLNELIFVPDDWNSYGSPSPSRPAIEVARGILGALFYGRLMPDRILPSADGGVALVFRTEGDNRAVVETLNDQTTYVLLYDRRGNSRTLTWDETAAEKRLILRQLDFHLRGTSLAAV
jgi:hypothetical protein